MTPLAMISDYGDLHAALRARAEELNVSRSVLDEVSGLENGYSGKLLAPKPLRHIGAKSLGPMLGALGAKLVLVEDPEQLARVASRLEKRNASQARVLAVKVQKNGLGKHRLVSLRFLRKIAAQGGVRRAETLSPTRRRQIARQAALTRWSDVKEAVKG